MLTRAGLQTDQSISHLQLIIIPVISWAGMTKVGKEQVLPENLYEAPTCSICQMDLSDDVSSLNCGHIFHTPCIAQQFEYKSICPNCNKPTHRNQLRPLVFSLNLNSKANSQLHEILAALSDSERKQVEHLLREVKQAAESVDRMKSSLASNEKDMAAQTKVIEGLKEELGRRRVEIDTLRRSNIEMDKNIKGISEAKSTQEIAMNILRSERDQFQKQIQERKDYQKTKRLLKHGAQELLKYKQELEEQKASPDDMIKIFFDLVLMKNLELLKAKQKIEENNNLPLTVNDLEAQIKKLKSTTESLKKELKDTNEKWRIDRKKYEQLKVKYRLLAERVRMGGIRQNDIPEMEDSQQGFFTAPTIPKSIFPLEEQLGQQTNRKPTFNSASTIGGLNCRKKTDKPKFPS